MLHWNYFTAHYVHQIWLQVKEFMNRCKFTGDEDIISMANDWLEEHEQQFLYELFECPLYAAYPYAHAQTMLCATSAIYALYAGNMAWKIVVLAEFLWAYQQSDYIVSCPVLISVKLKILKLYNTHNRFTALLEYVRDHPGEQVPER